MTNAKARLLAAGLAGVVVLGAAAPVVAAPTMIGSAVLKSAAPEVTQVRWHGGGAAIAGGIIAGLAAGAIAGAAAAPYYYGGPYYDYYPAPAPVYVDPGPYYPRTYYYWGRDPAGCGPGAHVC
jgi:hypothetical protein